MDAVLFEHPMWWKWYDINGRFWTS